MIETLVTGTGLQKDDFDRKEHCMQKQTWYCMMFLFIQIFSYSSAAGVRALIFKKNMKAKEEVNKEFKKLNKVKVSFIDRLEV